MAYDTSPHRTRGGVNKKTANMAADNLMAQVAHENCVHAEKKKKRQEEKEAEEEHL
jgi:hypothetical protein